MKKYIFTVQNYEKFDSNQQETILIIAKNIQSAVAKLTAGNFYKEDDILNIEISKS